MPDLHHPDLDDRLRDLVARAVADAPEPPELDPSLEPRRPDHRRWWIGGGAALAAAAASVALVTLAGNDDKVITSPATDPPSAPTVAPTTVPASEPIPPTTLPTPATAPPGGNPNQPVEAQTVVAGPDGIVLLDPSGSVIRRSGEVVQMALPVGDGRVVVQREVGPAPGGPGTADTEPLVWLPDGTLTALWPQIAVETRDVRLHDLAIVDGRPTLLFSIATGTTPDDSSTQLYTHWLDDPNAGWTSLGEIGGWESGTSRLQIGPRGIIVGESYAEASSGLVTTTLAGASGGAGNGIDAALLGLEEVYFDCTDCPRLYAIAPHRRTVAWVEGSDLVTVDLDAGGRPVRTPLPAAMTDPDGIELTATGGVLLTQEPSAGRPAVSWRPGGEATALDGLTATEGPAVIDLDAPTPRPPSTEPAAPPTSTAPAAGNAGVATELDGPTATFGADGR